MKNKNLFGWAVVDAVAVALYAGLVAGLVINIGQRFKGPVGFQGPAVMLMLLVFSVALVGLLIFGRPAWLYLVGDKSGALRLVLWTLAVLAVITLLTFIWLFKSYGV